MRKLLILSLAAILAVPALAQGAWEHARRAPRKRARPAPALVQRDGRALFAPSPLGHAPVRATPRLGYGRSSWILGADPLPFWLGWSWGWGYYPLWPRPDYLGTEPGRYPEDAQRLSARLEAFGAASDKQAAGTLALSFEGRSSGVNASVGAFTVPGVDPITGNGSALTLGAVHATWSIVSEAAFRMRLELGASMLSVPTAGVWSGSTYAGTISFGPDVGVSGHVGLAGPFGLEGYARLTPFPVPVLDTRAAFVVRGGAVAVSAGWRVIDVNGDGTDAPEAHFAGPELGLQLGF